MIAAGPSGAPNSPSISSCHWQLLKTHHHNKKHDSDDHCNRGLRLPRSRQRHSACRVGEFVYVLCGKDGTSPLKDIWKYHIYHQTWEMVEMRGGSLPLLQGHTAVAYKRLIVIFGGTFNNNVNDIQLWIFNTDLGHLREVWAEHGPAQPLCRRDHSAVMHNNLMYVFGGFKDPTGATQELWAFNMDEEEWTELTQLSHCRPSGRYGHTAVVADSAMWIFGGTAGLSPCTDFWKYSFSLHQWTKLKCLGSPPSPLSGHSTCVIHHQMIVVGGTCRGKPLSDVWSYRFDTNTWRKLNSAGIPLPGLSFHICVPVSHQDLRNPQSTDRAVSTPHLKLSTHLLHPDRFVVRPRTSPSTMEETTPRASHGEDGKPSQVQDTQVMSLEELKSVTTDLGNTNSSHRADPRIDVSLKEPLMSDSPGTAGFYDSCIPFSPRHDGETCQELEVLQHVSLGHRSESESVVPDGTSCPREGSHKAVTVDLIDLSDSPVLKAFKHGFESAAMIRKEITFWNDLFIEDLETSDDGGLDEVKISYPSQNPVLPHPCPMITNVDGLEVVGDASVQRWKDNGQQQHTNNNVLQNTAENHDHGQLPDLKHLRLHTVDVDTTHQSKSVPGRNPLVMPQLKSQVGDNRGDLLKSDASDEVNQLTPQNTDTVQSQRSRCSLVNKDGSILVSSQEQTHRDRNSNSSNCKLDSIEAETSFIDIRDLAEPQLPSTNPSGHTVSGKTRLPSAYDSFLASSSIGRSEGMTGGVTSGIMKRMKHAEDCALGEMALEEPFLLVLGGKMEEQINIQPKPIAVWKGSFV